VARGAALMCAMLSPIFKVRDFQVQDTNNWPVLMSYPASSMSTNVENGYNDNLTRQIVLQRYAPSPCTAKITFYKKESFQIMFEHPKDEVKLNETQLLKVEYPMKCNLGIGEFKVEMLELSPNSVKDPQIKLILSLNKHGLLEIPQAELIEFIEREVKTKPEPMDVEKPETIEKSTVNTTSNTPSQEMNQSTKNIDDALLPKEENKDNQDQEMTDKTQNQNQSPSESKNNDLQSKDENNVKSEVPIAGKKKKEKKKSSTKFACDRKILFSNPN